MSVKIGDHEIDVSNRDKVFFPDDDTTKGDVIDYYRRIAPTMLPHIRDRFMMMQRFPDGIGEQGFYHKDVPGYFPDWISRRTVTKEDGELDMLICDKTATLVYLADQGTVTPHVWLSRVDTPKKPDRLIFDLDPPDTDDDSFDLVRDAARALIELYQELDVTPFAMTTGSRGLHVVVPLDGTADFDASRSLANEIAEEIERRDPDRFTTASRKQNRGGRLYLDIVRNAYAQTTVAPYALRARPGAPVATPVTLDEVGDGAVGPQSYTIGNIFRRLGQREDPWKDIARHAVSVEAVRRRLESINGDTEG